LQNDLLNSGKKRLHTGTPAAHRGRIGERGARYVGAAIRLCQLQRGGGARARKIAYEVPAENANRPKAWRQIHEVHIRPVKPGLMRFGVSPNFHGCLSECREFAREQAANLNLQVIEVQGVNRDLEGPDFADPAIYIRTVEFDELDPRETRIYRNW
jgi:hypothetical protein